MTARYRVGADYVEYVPGRPYFSILQVMKNWEGGRNEANMHTYVRHTQVYICNQREYVEAQSYSQLHISAVLSRARHTPPSQTLSRARVTQL